MYHLAHISVCSIIYSVFICVQDLSAPTAYIKLDGANGVGADKVKKLLQSIQAIAGNVINIEVFNDGTCGILNENVCMHLLSLFIIYLT